MVGRYIDNLPHYVMVSRYRYRYCIVLKTFLKLCIIVNHKRYTYYNTAYMIYCIVNTKYRRMYVSENKYNIPISKSNILIIRDSEYLTDIHRTDYVHRHLILGYNVCFVYLTFTSSLT